MFLIGIISVAAACQAGLYVHVRRAAPEPVALVKPICDIPHRLGPWHGVDVEADGTVDFADQYVKRTYRHKDSGRQVTLWTAYSQDGDDRTHHPQLCMAVLGRRENETLRRSAPLPGPGDPARVCHFGRPGQGTWTFYWHYSLRPPCETITSPLARAFHRLRRMGPSVTVELFVPEESDDDVACASGFARLVDAALRSHVGPAAVRGSSPLSVVQTRTN